MKTNTKKINGKNPFKRFTLIIESVALIATCVCCVIIGSALKDKNRYDSKEIQEFILNKYSWNDVVERTMKIYKEIKK